MKKMDMENRLRRNNLRVVVLPERAEGTKPEEALSKFRTNLLGLTKLSPTYTRFWAQAVSYQAPEISGL